MIDFGAVLKALKHGKRAAREGWNGKGMYIYLVKGHTFAVEREPLCNFYEKGQELTYCPHIDLKTASGDLIPWTVSQADALAEDWQIIE